MPRSPFVVKNGSRQRRRLLVHADAVVAHLDPHLVLPLVLAVRTAQELRAQRQRAAGGQRVDGVEDEIDQGFADFALDARDRGQLFRKLALQRDHGAAKLRHVAPARPGQVDDLLHEIIEPDRHQRQLRLALPVEFAHARDRVGHVVDRPLDRLQILARARAEVRLHFQQGLGIERHR